MSDESLELTEEQKIREALRNLDPLESQKSVNEEFRIEEIKNNVTYLLQHGKDVVLTEEIIELGLREWFLEKAVEYEAYYRINKIFKDTDDEKTYF